MQGAPQNKGDPLPSEVIGVHASPVCPWAEAVYMCLPLKEKGEVLKFSTKEVLKGEVPALLGSQIYSSGTK